MIRELFHAKFSLQFPAKSAVSLQNIVVKKINKITESYQFG